MVECGNGGRVVNTSTTAAITGAAASVGTSHYASAKAALVNMTQIRGWKSYGKESK